MPILNNKTIIDNSNNLNLGDLNLEIEINNNIKINKNIFINNYCNDNKKKLINITFTYNKEDKEITEYKLKLKNKDKKLYKTNALIVAGGGGGGYNVGGGGGGGRVIYFDNFLLNTNINYNIYVGKGGEGGTDEYENGESGYNSGLSTIVAIGGGGGSSYVNDNPINLLETDEKKLEYSNENGKGKNGGSGGGSNCLQYKDEIEGTAKGISKELEKNYDYYSFGNNGGSSYYIKKFDNSDKILLRGSGGGGAYENGENNYSITNTEFGKGGDGIAIEDINIGYGDKYKFCPIISNTNIDCIYHELSDKTNRKLANLDNNYNKIYWGAGGGGGSCNIMSGYGGKGGGGSGGYYENINKLPDLNLIGIGGKNFFNINDYYKNSDKININNNGLSSALSIDDISDEKLYKLTKGGDGIEHTGSGGGGGGIGSFGGNGGSGIVILLIETEEYVEEEDEYIDNSSRLSKLITNFETNKEILGLNLSKFYYYNIKDNKEFYSYIDKIYNYNIDKSNIIIPFSYDRKTYDSKFHEYIKIIYDLKIEYETILFYIKEENSNKYIDNNNLFNYQRLILILIDILEDLLIFKREYNEYYKILKNLKIIEIKYINKYRINNHDVNVNLNSETLKEDIHNIDILIFNKESEFNERVKLIVPNYNSLSESQKKIKIQNINNNLLNKLKYDIDLLKNLKNTKENKITSNIKEDLYFTYDERVNKLILYISNNNNYKVRNFYSKEKENIIDNGIFGADQNNNEDKLVYDDIENFFKYDKIDNYLKDYDLTEANKLSDFIKMYLFTFINVKEYNFNRNLITQYLYFNQVLILQTFYKDCEKLLISNNIKYETDIEYKNIEKEILNICGDYILGSNNQNKPYKNGLYDLLVDVDNVVKNIKSLTGYNYINQYINNFKINYAYIISNSCPYITIKLTSYDTNRIKKYFRESINNNSDNFDINKEEVYYNNLVNSFVIEIDNKRFNIIEFKFIDKNQITLKFEDRNYKICKIEDINRLNNLCKLDHKDFENIDKKICNILILQKDSTFIKDIYKTDVEKIEEYGNKINTFKKELDNIEENYNILKNKYNTILLKNYIYYIIIAIISFVIIFVYFFSKNTKIISISLSIILSIIILLIIINYFTKIHYNDIIEKFSNKNIDIENFEYYKINKGTVVISDKIQQNWKIKIFLSEQDKNKLKFIKEKNSDIELIKNKLINNLTLLNSNNNELLKIINLDIYSDDNFNYITHILFISNEEILLNKIINNFVILKNEDDVYESLIYNHNHYITWKNNTKCKLYNNINIDKNLEEHKLLHIYTIRNDILRYINNRYPEISKIIESIELEKANNIYNKVDNVLKTEKNTYYNYQNEYIYKKKHNNNINNLFKHKIIFQVNFLNMGLILYLILILILLLINIFPNNIKLILVIGLISIIINIFLFSTKILHSIRKNANKKYWNKPNNI